MLSTAHLSEFSGKLSARWIGPCEVIDARPSQDTYRLKLPKLAKRVFDWVHVSRLKAYTEPVYEAKRPAPVNYDTGEEYEVDFIIDSKFSNRSKSWQYKIRWRGYGPEHDSWEPESNLAHAAAAIAEWKAKRGTQRRGRRGQSTSARVQDEKDGSASKKKGGR